MKRDVLVFQFLLFLSLLGKICFSQVNDSSQVFSINNSVNLDLEYKIIPCSQGTWGYDIFENGKLCIHQTTVPALPGNNGFKSKGDAKRVAKYVIKKIISGEWPPTILIEELEEMGVL